MNSSGGVEFASFRQAQVGFSVRGRAELQRFATGRAIGPSKAGRSPASRYREVGWECGEIEHLAFCDCVAAQASTGGRNNHFCGIAHSKFAASFASPLPLYFACRG